MPTESTAVEPTPEIRAMRVAVARDVLAQLDREDVRGGLVLGDYLRGPARRDPGAGRPVDLQQCADEAQAGCSWCLLGALLLSKARLYNRVPLAPLFSWDPAAALHAGREPVLAALDDVFDRDTLDLVESAFMCTWMGNDEERWDSSPLGSAAIAFGRRYDDDRAGMLERARAVMANIIHHDGEFRPDLPAPAPGGPTT
jgi:hypothetical protein